MSVYFDDIGTLCYTFGNMGSSKVHFAVDIVPPNITDVSQFPANNVQPEDKVNNTITTDELFGY